MSQVSCERGVGHPVMPGDVEDFQVLAPDPQGRVDGLGVGDVCLF